jgi:hypothetical protein
MVMPASGYSSSVDREEKPMGEVVDPDANADGEES